MASIQKRGGKYRIRVSCGYDNSGKQITKSMTWTPPQGMTAKQIKRELERAAYEFEMNHDPAAGRDGSIRFEEYAERQLSLAAMRLAPLTIQTYRYTYKRVILPAIGRLRLRDIQPGHIQDIIIRASKSGLSRGSISNIITALSMVLSAAVRERLIPDNPASGKYLQLPRQKPARTQALSRDEVREILELLENESMELRLLVHLAICTGCRGGELAGLMWEDIDFEEAVISISRSTYKIAGRPVAFKEPKTLSSVRQIAVPDYILDMLREWHARQYSIAQSFGDLWEGAGTVFTSRKGGILLEKTLYNRWSDFQERHGLRHCTLHALRHTSATMLLASGVNIKNVSSRLGHSQLQTTNRYLHAVTEADRAAADTIGNIMQPEEGVKIG